MMFESEKEEKDCQKVISGNGENPSMMIDGSRPSPSQDQSVKKEQILDEDPKENCVYCSKEDQFLFDRFIRCKQEDKPKDTLAWISFKRMEFLRYLNTNALGKDDSGLYQSDDNHDGASIQMRRLYECTILRQIDQGALLIVRVKASQPFKCNIIASDHNGAVVKYFPNALLIKKREKIIKLAQEYQKNSLVIIDQTSLPLDHLYFTPFFRKSRSLTYYIMNLPLQHYLFCQPELSELAQSKKLSFLYTNNRLKIDSEYFSKEAQQRQLIQDISSVFRMIEQEQTFLLELRGAKQEKDKILELDLLGVSLWRRNMCSASDVANKINKLYKMKAESTLEQNKMVLQPGSDIHVPLKTKKQQNCAFCLSTNPTLKPKRTCFVCKACSASKEKPIYLCRKCFQGYHKNPPAHMYKKNQKKTKKLIKLRRRRDALALKAAKTKIEQPELVQDPEEIKKRVTQERFKRLDKLATEVFEKVESLMQEQGENNIKSCEFFLNMILNNNIRFMETLAQNNTIVKQENPTFNQ